MALWLTYPSIFVRASTDLGRAMLGAAKPRFALGAQEIARDAKASIVGAAPRGWREPYGEGRLSDRSHYVTKVSEVPQGYVINFSVKGSARFMAKFHSVNSGSSRHPIDSGSWMPMLYRPGGFSSRPAGMGKYRKHVRGGYGHPGNHFYDDAIEGVIARARAYFR